MPHLVIYKQNTLKDWKLFTRSVFKKNLMDRKINLVKNQAEISYKANIACILRCILIAIISFQGIC